MLMMIWLIAAALAAVGLMSYVAGIATLIALSR